MLFSSDPEVNRSQLYRYLDLFSTGAGLRRGSVKVEAARMDALAIQLAENASSWAGLSPFKIAGIFSVEFVRHNPVITAFEAAHLARFNPNAVFAYFYSVDGLVNARIAPQGIFRRLPRRIKVSVHFFREFSEVLSKCRTTNEASLCALIYESLCYQCNDGFYERVL